MARPRLPVWFYLVAASYLVFAATMVYSVVYPPAPVGVSLDQQAGVRTISLVMRGSPAERAGLRIGDRIVDIDGWPMNSPIESISRSLTTEVDRPARWVVDRPPSNPSKPHERVVLEIASRGRELTPDGLPYMVAALVSAGLGLLIMSRRPRDIQAVLGGLVLVGCGSQPFAVPRGLIPLWRELPLPLGLLLWLPAILGFFTPLLFFVFCGMFPRRVVRRGVLITAVAVWAPFGAYTIGLLAIVVANPRARPAFGSSFLPIAAALNTICVLGGVWMLARAARLLADVNEQRRVRIALAGLAAGGIGILNAVLVTLVAGFKMPALISDIVAWTRPLTPLLFLLLPLGFTVAILRHRLFDVGVFIRVGLQYVVARGVLLSLVPGIGVVLLVDLLVHAGDPLVETLTSRGWIYATAIAIAVVANMQRVRWMGALDRQFFRDRYESERLLREVADDVRRAPSFEAAAREVAQRIEQALHPEFVALFVRHADATSFTTLISVPAGRRLVLERDSKIAGLVRVLGGPVDLSTGSVIADHLRAADVEQLQTAGVDLLVPIVTGLTAREAILVLGRKKSEEPYSRQDRELLAAVASNLAVLLERPSAGSGQAPANVALPTLTPRYALVKRIGQGGMGTVYEALDTDLQRAVAIKVIREDAAADPAFAERFRREALAAAGFAHPHVVSIYDFGLAPDGRMFIVMERLIGATLRETLQTKSRFPPADAARVLEEICTAADAAHRRQIVHRDLKPENVFLVRDGSLQTVKVVDFGIARSLAPAAASAVTGTGQVIGTIQYMAPEQVGGATATASADLWAIAVIAYEMIAGGHPFAGETGFEWTRAALGRFTPLEDDLARYNDFFTRAFAAHPSERYPNAAALADAFSVWSV